MTSLHEMCDGASGRVVRLDMAPADGSRLAEMGMTVGSMVKVIRSAPLGDPMEVLVRGYHLSLRGAEARHVQVEPAV